MNYHCLPLHRRPQQFSSRCLGLEDRDGRTDLRGLTGKWSVTFGNFLPTLMVQLGKDSQPRHGLPPGDATFMGVEEENVAVFVFDVPVLHSPIPVS